MNATNVTATNWRDIEPLLDEAMQALDEYKIWKPVASPVAGVD